MYVPRTLERFALSAQGQFPVLLVTGARQVGKTTLLRHVSEPERTYVTLDDPLVLDLARRDPALFLQRFQAEGDTMCVPIEPYNFRCHFLSD